MTGTVPEVEGGMAERPLLPLEAAEKKYPLDTVFFDPETRFLGRGETIVRLSVGEAIIFRLLRERRGAAINSRIFADQPYPERRKKTPSVLGEKKAYNVRLGVRRLRAHLRAVDDRLSIETLRGYGYKLRLHGPTIVLWPRRGTL